MTKIMVSKDRKTATIYFSKRGPFGLYCSEGRVLDLLAIFLKPIECPHEITWDQLVNSENETVSMQLQKVG